MEAGTVQADAGAGDGQASFGQQMKRFQYKARDETAGPRRSPRLKANSGQNPAALAVSEASKRARSTAEEEDDDTALPRQTAKRSRPLPPPTPHRSGSQKVSSKYAHPSRYAHLSPLTDILQPGLLLVFVGVNPGVATATAGHAYAHPSNRFWGLLHTSGLTSRKHSPSEDGDLPRLYGYGNTNIVSRPSKDQAELSKQEMVQGTADLEAKFHTFRPEAVCIVGKGIWEAIWMYKHRRRISKDEFRYGWQSETENMGRRDPGAEQQQPSSWPGARVFVATSTSGLAAAIGREEREAIWKELGDCISARRRALASPGATTTE